MTNLDTAFRRKYSAEDELRLIRTRLWLLVTHHDMGG